MVWLESPDSQFSKTFFQIENQLNINPLLFMSMWEHVVIYSSEACGSMLHLIALSMEEDVSIFSRAATS